MGPIRSLSLISGPDEVIVLYWAMLLGFCTCFILGRAPRTKKTLSNFFLKSWVLEKGAQWCGIGLPDIHEFFVG